MQETKEQQLFFMRRALALAEKGRLTAPPNPWVGCVIVRGNQVFGEGFHEAAGQPHAEIKALQQAGRYSKGATAYVSLEPCCHFGRTPPCIEAIIHAGLKRVVIPILDPDPRVSGSGVLAMQNAGIEVVVGVGKIEAENVLAPYLHQRRTGKPFCVLKVAASLDGRVAARDGSSHWITGEGARKNAHKVRAESQAILIGPGTASLDKPYLTVRYGHAIRSQPLRVIIDPGGTVPTSTSLFNTNLAPTLICTTPLVSQKKMKEWESKGVEVEIFNCVNSKHIDLAEILNSLGKRGIIQLLVEGGPSIQSCFMQNDLADHLIIYYGNCLIGPEGRPLFLLNGPESIQLAKRLKLKRTQRIDNDVRMDFSIEKN